jgi:hypothetical protein
LDFINLKSVDLPEGFVEETGAAEDAEEGEDAAAEARNELTYICGRVWLNDEPKTDADKAKKLIHEKSQKSIQEGDGEEKSEKPSARSDHNKSKDT